MFTPYIYLIPVSRCIDHKMGPFVFISAGSAPAQENSLLAIIGAVARGTDQETRQSGLIGYYCLDCPMKLPVESSQLVSGIHIELLIPWPG